MSERSAEKAECGAIPPNVGGPVPCHLEPGHDGEHFSTSGCAGSEIRWRDAPETAQRTLTRTDVIDAVSWDHRKELASLWQDHCPLPEGGLSEWFYDAVIAVACWGAESAWEYAEPVVNPPGSRCCPGAGTMAHVRGCVNHPESAQ